MDFWLTQKLTGWDGKMFINRIKGSNCIKCKVEEKIYEALIECKPLPRQLIHLAVFTFKGKVLYFVYIHVVFCVLFKQILEECSPLCCDHYCGCYSKTNYYTYYTEDFSLK